MAHPERHSLLINHLMWNSSGLYTLNGLLKKQSITSYQYGTHVIVTEAGEYALTSRTIELDAFINLSVTVVGKKIQGYPLEDGPEYLEVQSVVQLPGE